MAIVKTNFSGATQAANAPEVLSWLQANASEYFDAIEADAGGNISCKIGETTVILFGFDGSTPSKLTLLNGTSITHYEHNDRFTYAYKTSKGIYLNSFNFGSVFITTSDMGTTAIAWHFKAAPDFYGYTFADFTHSSEFYAPITGNWDNSRINWVHAASLTALTPVIFGGTTYSPNLYLLTFSEYYLLKCNFTIGLTQYTSDGVLALVE